MIAIPDFSRLRVLVVGDVMLDRYWYGDVTRISQEAPVPVVAVNRIEERAGGAANVAMGCAALGARVTLVSVIGADEAGRRLDEIIGTTPGVRPMLELDPGMQTTVKLRVLGQRQQMIRLDFEDAAPDRRVIDRMTGPLHEIVAEHDIVIASDYGKGALARVQDLIQAARKAGKPVFVDPKGPDWSKYAGAALVKPNAAEFKPVNKGIGGHVGPVLVTRGADGMDLYQTGDPIHQRAYTRDVADVTGAGDTVMAVVACMRAAGRPWQEALYLASKAAGIAVSRVGTVAVTRWELAHA